MPSETRIGFIGILLDDIVFKSGALDSGSDAMNPRWYERYAWLIFFVFGALLLWYGIYLFLLPRSQPHHWDWLSKDPAVVRYIADNFRWQGLLVTGFALLMLTSSATSFRKGEKWAWYTYWFFPAFWLAAMFVTWPGALLTPFLLLSLAGLWLPHRVFFRETLNTSPEVRRGAEHERPGR